jgi:hypothetical protein
MGMKYDPLREINAEEWLKLSEDTRIALIEEHHRRKRIRMPNLQAHALIHAVVENQIAMGDKFPAKAALQRLMDEGLDRHDAVHAIGSLVAKVFFKVMKHDVAPGTDINREYEEKLKRLTAAGWIAEFGEK